VNLPFFNRFRKILNFVCFPDPLGGFSLKISFDQECLMFDIQSFIAILCIAIYGSLLPALDLTGRNQFYLLADEMEMRCTLYY